jgi:hypothetical protein
LRLSQQDQAQLRIGEVALKEHLQQVKDELRLKDQELRSLGLSNA